MTLKKVGLLALSVALVLTLAACGQEETPAEGAVPEEAPVEASAEEGVALVNGQVITQARYDRQLAQFKAMYEQQGMNFETEDGAAMLEQVEASALDQLIQEEVLLQAASEAGVEMTEEEIQVEIDAIKEQFESEEELSTLLASLGMEEEDLTQVVRTQMTIDTFLAQSIDPIEVTDEEVRENYDAYVAYMEDQETPEGQEPMELPTFEEFKEVMRDQLANEKQGQAVSDFIGGLMEESEIKVF